MEICLNFMGEDFIADVDFDIDSYGSPAHMGSLTYPGDPGDPPEFTIMSIHLRRDLSGGAPAPEFEATGALFDCLCDNERIGDAICEAIWNSASDDMFDYY